MRTGARVGTNSSNRIAAVVADSVVVRLEAARGEVVVAEVGRRANAETDFESSPPTLFERRGVRRPESGLIRGVRVRGLERVAKAARRRALNG
jgi:hypothetical protein